MGYFSSSLLETNDPTPVIQVPSAQLEMKSCFTPQQKCLPLIVNEINQAKKMILMQCYSFTSQDIADALIRAHHRGVKITIITDKSQLKERYSKIPILFKNGINVLVDTKPSIAHNKLILIDNLTTIGGSYNFTNAAENRNTENITIIKNKQWTSLFVENFYRRKNVSVYWNGNNKNQPYRSDDQI